MRGVIFTELFELIEEKFGYDKLDEVIDSAQLANDGAFAATGNYPFDELLKLVVSLSEHTGIEIPQLLEVFGEFLFNKLISIFKEFNKTDDVLVFLSGVEEYIHVEVKKLYPDAELPTFEVLSCDENTLEMNYVSAKNMPTLAKGLMIGASKYFKQPIDIQFTVLEDKTHFVVTKV